MVKHPKKTCTKCGEEKDLNCFYPRWEDPFKKRADCKTCMNKDCTRRHYERSYGLTEKAHHELLKNTVCAICKTTSNNKQKRSLEIDHCHESGKIRGILCSRCNIGLSKFRDSVILLEEAIKYLKDASSV